MATAAFGLVLALGTAGCATFPDNGPRNWSEKLEGAGELGGPPSVAEPPPPPTGQTPPSSRADSGNKPPPNVPCVDPDPQVIATCLAPVGAIAVLPDGDAALVGERTTGRILRVQHGVPPQLVATVPVDAAAGGLTGLVLSPGYAEDQLLYAYVTTPADNRVVRIAPGEPAKPILAGIPRGPRHNAGALAVDVDGSLLVATGDAGAAQPPTSPAGKVLRIDTLGKPAAHNPVPTSPVLGTGVSDPGGMCVDPQRGSAWVTDHAAAADVLSLVMTGGPVTTAWRWPDRPGVAGCHAADGGIVIAQSTAKAAFLLRYVEGAQFTGNPETTLQGKYGRLGPAAGGPDGSTWLGTVNKDPGGAATPNDDRVVRLQLAPSGGGAVQ